MTSGENLVEKFYLEVTNILLKKLCLLLIVISRLYNKIVFVFMKKAISYFAKLSACQSSCTVEIHGFSHRALDICIYIYIFFFFFHVFKISTRHGS